MRLGIELKKILLLAFFSFFCGILCRMVMVNHNQPDFVFYRTLEPQFALVAEQTTE